jgi:hypothetical protein
MMNSIIHTLMYFYFLLTSLGATPAWDFYMTCAQMLQFVLMMAQGAAIVAGGCPFPNTVAKFYVGYIGAMLLLFAQFFVGKYLFGSKKPAAAKGAATTPAVADADAAAPTSSKKRGSKKAN